MPTAFGLSCSSHALPLKLYPTGALSRAASSRTSSCACSQPSPPKMATVRAWLIRPAMAARSAAEAAPMVVAGSGTRSGTGGAAACATSPGSEITTGPRSATRSTDLSQCPVTICVIISCGRSGLPGR